MIIQVDTREKARAIKSILAEFDRQNITHISSKLYAGDYINLENPLLIIDRKQTIRELATNCTSERKRVEAELDRVKQIGAVLVFLVEESSVQGRPIETLEDIMDWTPPKGFGTVSGYQVYRTLFSWSVHYPVRFEFCKRSETGRRIIELLSMSRKEMEEKLWIHT